MRQSSAGPIPEGIALCERLLHQPIDNPQATLFDDEYIKDCHNTLQNRLEAHLLGRTWLKDIIDGYNDPWLKTEPTQPDHARGLKWSTFSESQRRKLGIKPDEKLPYTVREDRWACYRFVENLDREYLPIHTDRLMQFLEGVPDPEEYSLSVDVDDADSQVLRIGSQDHILTESGCTAGVTYDGSLELQVKLAGQREREEKREAEQKAREDRLLAEQREQKEQLLAQLEQQRVREEKLEAEQKALQEKLLTLLEQKN